MCVCLASQSATFIEKTATFQKSQPYLDVLYTNTHIHRTVHSSFDDTAEHTCDEEATM